MERYKNKWFRLTLEKDLKTRDLGVNVHCKEDGIHITVPPYPPTGDDFTNDYAKEMFDNLMIGSLRSTSEQKLAEFKALRKKRGKKLKKNILIN